jgi:hypothetical protein
MDNPGRQNMPAIPLPPFSRAGYRHLVERFLEAGYLPVTFDRVRRERRDLIVRHDVDVSLDAAVNIGEIEREMGVQATYFVMISNSFYNIHSYEGRRALARLSELGHHIGLHFDTTHYADDNGGGDLTAAINHEFRVLAAVIGDPIDIISFHNPVPGLVNHERLPGWPPHTYEPRFFRDLTYVADSGGSWRFGGPFERQGFQEGTAVHLLTHPLWWAHDEPDVDAVSTLKRYTANHMAQLHASLIRGFKAYRESTTHGKDKGTNTQS